MRRVAVVLAGGLGTRLHSITRGLVPKVLVPVNGRPFIEHKLESLRVIGITDAVILVGAGGTQVIDHLRDHPVSSIDVTFQHDGDVLLGTGGAIRAALPRLPAEFWVTYGDSLVVADLGDAELSMQRTGSDAVMTVFENCDEWDSSNVRIDGDRVVEYRKNVEPGMFRWIDYGLLCFRAHAFEAIEPCVQTDLRAVVDPLVARRMVLAYPVRERFWEIGTPDGLTATGRHLAAIEHEAHR